MWQGPSPHPQGILAPPFCTAPLILGGRVWKGWLEQVFSTALRWRFVSLQHQNVLLNANKHVQASFFSGFISRKIILDFSRLPLWETNPWR